MATVRVSHGIGDLAGDLARIPRTLVLRGNAVVARNAENGNRLAKKSAKRTAGAHGVHYHKAFTAERVGPMAWEYGPDSGMPQGGMSFEFGSRNQPPHLDLAKSLDRQAPRFHRDISRMVDGLFW